MPDNKKLGFRQRVKQKFDATLRSSSSKRDGSTTRQPQSQDPPIDDLQRSNNHQQQAACSTHSGTDEQAPLAHQHTQRPGKSSDEPTRLSAPVKPSTLASQIVTTPAAHPTLYEDALAKIDNLKYRELLKEESHNQIDLFRATLQRAEDLQEKHANKTWKWQFRGHEIVPKDLFDSVCNFLKQIEPVGDKLAELDPIHAGLPWAAIKTIVELSIANQKQRALLMQGINYVLFYSKRLDIYVRLKSDNIHETLVDTYACILEFLAAAIQTYKKNSFTRSVQALWTLSALTDFVEKLERCRDRLREDAQNDVNEEFREQLERLNDIEDALVTIEQKLDLATLKVIPEAKYNAYGSTRCLAGTRIDILAKVAEWTHAQDEPILWLCGKAGTGKSTLARTVAASLEKEIMISFFFKRTESGRDNAKRLWSTLAGQLKDQLPGMRRPLVKALQDSSICDSTVDNQYKRLFEEPLRECDTTADLYIVLDALDECDDRDLMQVVSVLASLDVPGVSIRAFITSRPDVAYRLRKLEPSKIKLEEVQERTINHDIRLFIDTEFKEMREYEVGVWPEEAQLQTLTEICVPLFIAASTYCQYISQDSRRLAQIIEERPGIDDIYSPILQSMLKRTNLKKYRTTVGPLAVASTSLSVEAYIKLMDVNARDFNLILEDLQSILDVEGTITFHLSFRDYLLANRESEEDDEVKQHKFHIDAEVAHQQMFEACIRVLDGLDYDMCDVKHIGTHRAEHKPNIADDVQYACRYWSQHANDEQAVESFLRRGLLHWIEAMSWLQEIDKAIRKLSALSCRWSQNQFLSDAVRFLVSMRACIEEAPLHTYVSALHYTPSQNLIKQYYLDTFRKHVEPWFSKIPDQMDTNIPLWTRQHVVHCVCFSKDGQYIAFCSRGSSTIYHCEASTGANVRDIAIRKGLLNGHDTIRMMYSNKADKITIHASYSNEVDVYDTITGLLIHTYSLDEDMLKLSPDGSMVTLRQEWQMREVDGPDMKPEILRWVTDIDGHIGVHTKVRILHLMTGLSSVIIDDSTEGRIS